MIYRHYKGGLYEVLMRGYMEADSTPVVIYRELNNTWVWVRPLAEFEKKFTLEKE